VKQGVLLAFGHQVPGPDVEHGGDADLDVGDEGRRVAAAGKASTIVRWSSRFITSGGPA